MSTYTDTLPEIRWPDAPKPSYDVVIIGGGGHGLSTAYYLATRHGITNVAVLEADYIASGNTGRNTTIIRANYGIPEAIRFYQHSLELYQGLEAETGAEILHQTKGIVWVAHTEMAMRTERARCLMNTACGAKTVMVTPGRAQGAGPADRPHRRRALPGARRVASRRGARRPGTTGSPGRSPSGASRRGVARHPAHAGHRARSATATGSSAWRRRAARSRPASSCRAVGGRVTAMAAMAGVRLPIRTHPLHAFVTNDYAQGFAPILASTELSCYVSQTERGQMLIGAEFDAQPSYSRQSSFAALRSYSYKITRLLPFLRELRILRTWAGICDISADFSADHGRDRRRRVPRHDRLGDVGLQGDPGRRRGDGRADRHRPAARAHRAVRARPLRGATTSWPTRARRGRADALARLPALRPPPARRVHVRRRAAPGRRTGSTDPDERDFDEVWIFENPDGVDDRALVPRRRLPALADGPARHLDRHRRGGRGVTTAGRSLDRDRAAQPRLVRGRARSSGCPRWSPRPVARASSS